MAHSSALVFDSFQFLLILVEGIVILNSPPGQFADFGNGCHVNAMLLALLEFGERMQAVAHIHHQHGITYVDVELFFRQPQIGGNTVQVTNNNGLYQPHSPPAAVRYEAINRVSCAAGQSLVQSKSYP